jgi:hypothetical protein
MSILNFQVWAGFEFWKNQNPQTGWSPLVNARSDRAQPLFRLRASWDAITHRFACGPMCHGRPYHHTWAGRELSLFASSSLSLFAPLSLLCRQRPALPLSTTTKLPSCHPTTPKEVPQCPVPPAPGSSSGRQLSMPGKQDSRAAIFLRELYYHRPPPVNLRPSLHPACFANLQWTFPAQRN